MKLRLILVASLVSLAMCGCASQQPTVNFGPTTIVPDTTISPECDAAGAAGDSGTQAIYDREGQLYDAIYADGTVTDAEGAQQDALFAETDRAFEALVEATLDSCATASQWLGMAKRHLAFVGSTGQESVTDSTIQIYCSKFLDTATCLDTAARGMVLSTK